MIPRFSVLYVGLALVLVLSVSPSAQAENQCLPQTPKTGYLLAQEKAGGHLIARHVGKSDADLAARLRERSNIMAASTFETLDDAEQAIQDAAALAAQAMNAWAQKANRQRRGSITVDLQRVVGRVAYRSLDQGQETIRVIDSHYVRLVMRRNGPGDCLLLTGYPALVLAGQPGQ